MREHSNAYAVLLASSRALATEVDRQKAEIADLKRSLSEVLTALDGREPEGGIYVSQAAQRVADLRRQLADFEKDALGSSLSWFEEAKKLAAGKVEAERQLTEAEDYRDGFAADLDHAEERLGQVTQERDQLRWVLNSHEEEEPAIIAVARLRTHAEALAEALGRRGLKPAALTAWQGFAKGESNA